VRILAVDPGGTTGWASWNDGVVEWGQIPGGVMGARSRLVELVGYVDVLLIERYTIGERTVKFSRQSDALEITGGLKWTLGVGDLVMQQPRDAKRLFTDERLRSLGWWARGEEHARDALRHLGFYLAKKRLIRLIPTDGE
jgi:hypothetical protein